MIHENILQERSLSKTITQEHMAQEHTAQQHITPDYKTQEITQRIKDPGSAITHFIGMLMAVFAAIPLLIKAAREPEHIYIISITVYAVSLILLYAASTSYHTFDKSERVNTILKKIDHMMISVLIAGSYTPICLLVLKGKAGIILLSIVWGIAILGILLKAFWVYCPKWVSSVLYIGMGWTCVLAFMQILNSKIGRAHV